MQPASCTGMRLSGLGIVPATAAALRRPGGGSAVRLRAISPQSEKTTQRQSEQDDVDQAAVFRTRETEIVRRSRPCIAAAKHSHSQPPTSVLVLGARQVHATTAELDKSSATLLSFS